MGINKVMLNNELLLDLTGDNIKPSDVREGIRFHGADGEEKTGTMPDRGAVSVTLDGTTTSYTVPEGRHDGTGTVKVQTQTKSVTPSASAQTVSPDSGYLLSKVSVKAAKVYATGTVTTAGTNTTELATLTINTGVTLKAADIFILLPDTSITQTAPGISNASKGACALRISETNYRLGAAVTNGLRWDSSIGTITYSGNTVTVAFNDPSDYRFQTSRTYRWSVLR